jgi:hypothetical protein
VELQPQHLNLSTCAIDLQLCLFQERHHHQVSNRVEGNMLSNRQRTGARRRPVGTDTFVTSTRPNTGKKRLKTGLCIADVSSMRSIATLCLLAGMTAARAWPQSEAQELSLRRQSADADYNREDLVSGRLFPMPYLYLGSSIMGGGYAVFAYRAEGGVNIEGTHLIFRALGSYDNGRKVNDNDQPNPNGHDRSLDAALYLRPAWPGWSRGVYFGGGYRWRQLSTTNYTKGAGRYQIGGGYDWSLRACEACHRSFSMRVNIDWVTAGQDWQNGSHGPDIAFTLPSPRENRHWFFREGIAVYGFHTTVTELDNAFLARQQRSEKELDKFANFGFLYRF